MWDHVLEQGRTTLLHGVSHLWEGDLRGQQGNADRVLHSAFPEFLREALKT